MKKSKKVLSVILALVMVFSSISAAFVAFAAKDDLYTEVITEEKVNALIGDADTLLKQKVITGDVFEEVYKLLPSLSALLNLGGPATASDTVEFYKQLYPERFANLTSEDGKIKADVVDENGAVTEKGTLTAFFDANPITFANDEEMVKEAEKIVDMILVDNVLSSVVFLFAFGGDMGAAEEFFRGVDKVCDALGVEQETSLYDALNFTTFQPDGEAVRTYFKNIINTVLPNAASGIVYILRNIADTADQALLYEGASDVINNLSSILKTLEGSLGGILPSDIFDTINGLVEDFNALPTLENPKRLDLEKIAVQALDAYANIDFDIVFVDDITKATDGKNFYLEHLDKVLEAVSTTENNAEAVVVLFDYIFNNVIRVPGNMQFIFKLVDMPDLNPEMFDTMSKDDVFELVYNLAGQASGRLEPTDEEESTTSGETVTEDTTESVTPPSNGDSAVIGIFAAMAVLSGAALVITKKRK